MPFSEFIHSQITGKGDCRLLIGSKPVDILNVPMKQVPLSIFSLFLHAS
jgi:hypothetical protein